mmetsp:Transcript_17640/g.54932  ORF Transcript_17640/g.54932 Transcript_17640/m.54932 type:complete len:208 (+) Transcript_17640:82-705(+)
MCSEHLGRAQPARLSGRGCGGHGCASALLPRAHARGRPAHARPRHGARGHGGDRCWRPPRPHRRGRRRGRGGGDAERLHVRAHCLRCLERHVRHGASRRRDRRTVDARLDRGPRVGAPGRRFPRIAVGVHGPLVRSAELARLRTARGRGLGGAAGGAGAPAGRGLAHALPLPYLGPGGVRPQGPRAQRHLHLGGRRHSARGHGGAPV